MISGSVIYLAGAVKEIKSGEKIISNRLGCIIVKFFVSDEIS